MSNSIQIIQKQINLQKLPEVIMVKILLTLMHPGWTRKHNLEELSHTHPMVLQDRVLHFLHYTKVNKEFDSLVKQCYTIANDSFNEQKPPFFFIPQDFGDHQLDELDIQESFEYFRYSAILYDDTFCFKDELREAVYRMEDKRNGGLSLCSFEFFNEELMRDDNYLFESIGEMRPNSFMCSNGRYLKYPTTSMFELISSLTSEKRHLSEMEQQEQMIRDLVDMDLYYITPEMITIAYPQEWEKEEISINPAYNDIFDDFQLQMFSSFFSNEDDEYNLQELRKMFSIISKMCSDIGKNIDVTLPLKKLENFALSMILLTQCSNKVQFVTASLVCLGHLTERTLSSYVVQVFDKLVESLWTVMDSQFETQGKVREAITAWERMSDSKLLDKLREFMSFCMTFGSLEFFGLSDRTASIIYGEFKASKKHKSVTSFALAFCDVAEYVFSRLCVCVETKSLGPLFHSSDDYAIWYDNCAKVMEWNLMLGQDCKIRIFSDQEFQTMCEDCIKKGEEYIKFAKSIKDRRELNALVSKIRIVYGDFMTAEIVGQPRQAPFTLLISGDSSIGKTSIQRILVSTFAQLTGLPDDPRYFYTRDPSDDFMSGFKSYMWFINMDDVATTAPKMLQGVDTGVAELFRYVQNIACTANMADLNEKGKVAIRPEFIIATTNAPTLNAEAMFTCPSAARRRLPWRVTPIVKREYRTDADTNMLDPSKCNQRDGEYADYWFFTVDEIRPKPLRNREGALNLDATEIRILTEVSLKDFLIWFIKTAKIHRERQEAMQKRMEDTSKIVKCKHSLPMYMCCEELETQSEVLVAMTTTVITMSSILLLLSFYIKTYFMSLSIVQMYSKYKNYRLSFPRIRNPLSYNNVNDEDWRSINRNSIMLIGDKAKQVLQENKRIVAAGVVIGAISLWRLSRSKMETQIKFVKPTPVNEKEKTRWVVDIPIFDRCNVLPCSVSSKGRSAEQVHEQISKNVSHVIFRKGNKTWAANAFFLGGFDVAINTHILAALPDITTATFTFYDKFTHIGKNTTMLFDKRTFLYSKIEYYDITILQIEEFGLFPSLKEFFPKQALKGSFNGVYIHRSEEGLTETLEVMSASNKMRINNNGSGESCQFHVFEASVREDTVKGFCGSPMVLETSAGFVICGIHSLGGFKKLACASVITQEQIPKKKQFNVGKCDMGEIKVLEEQMELNNNKFLQPPVILTPILRQKDPLAYRMKGLGEVYGSLSTGPSHPKTKVQDTFVRRFWELKGKTTNCVAPKFGARCWHKGLDDMMSEDILISSGEANFVAETIARDFISKMTQEQINMIEFYDYETAILGADGINGVEKLDFNTSTGFPMKKCKKLIFEQLPNGKYSVPREVIQACDDIHSNLDRKERSQVIFSASLKDEPRDKKKVEDWSIRIFMSAPMPYCIVMRQYYLSLCRVIQRSPLQFETAVGINAHSDQWDILANTLADFSPQFIVGDHSKYDKRMLAMYIYNMFKVAIIIIMHCMKVTGKIHTDEEDEIEDRLHLLAIDTAYAFVDFNGTLVSFLKNHVSGHILTVIINSFANSGYIRMAYRRVVTDDPQLEKFQQRCKVITYGDDFIVAVKPEISHFNFISMKEAMGTFGVVITPAIKTDEDYEFLPITEIDFLKRKFVYNTDLQRWVGPLSIESIEKSLLIAVQSDSITPQEQSLYAMLSASQEMFFHGKEQYDRFVSNVKECIAFYDMQYLVKKNMFFSYEEYVYKYKNNSVVHKDEFIEYPDDDIFYEIQYINEKQNKKYKICVEKVEGEDELDTQCECQNTMELNQARIQFNPEFEEYLYRDYRDLFQNRIKKKFRQLVCKFICRTPYGFSCESFCWLCQQSPQTNFVADLLMRDCQSFMGQKN